MKDSLNIAIAGATGYVGLELIKILSKHSKAKILYLCANKSAGKKIYTFDRKILKKNLPKITKIKNINWNTKSRPIPSLKKKAVPTNNFLGLL